MRFAHQSWVFIYVANVNGTAESMHCYKRQAGMQVQKQNEMVLNRSHSAMFGLPFGSLLPKWQDFAIPHFSTGFATCAPLYSYSTLVCNEEGKYDRRVKGLHSGPGLVCNEGKHARQHAISASTQGSTPTLQMTAKRAERLNSGAVQHA